MESEQLSESLTDLAKAISQLSSETTSNETVFTFIQPVGVSLLSALVAFAVSFFVGRWFGHRDRTLIEAARIEAAQRQATIDLVNRFNSAEVLRARSEAEQLMLDYPCMKFADIPDDEPRKDSIWVLTRENEFLAIGWYEGILDRKLTYRYFSEIFAYWLQHFRFIFEGEIFETVLRLKELETEFRSTAELNGDFDALEERQKNHIVRLVRKKSGDEAADRVIKNFASPPGLLSGVNL